MSRRATAIPRRVGDSASVARATSLHLQSRSSSLLSVGLVTLGGLVLVGYLYNGLGRFSNDREAFKFEGSCSMDVQQAIPSLKRAYGDSMHKVLHVGLDTCSVVSKLLKLGDTEVWGIEPYELKDGSLNCKTLVKKGIVRVADLKYSLPYKPKSFSLVIISDALDYLSTRYLNGTLQDLSRQSIDGLVVFSGYPGQYRPNVSELSKGESRVKLRSSSWWARYFVDMKFEKKEGAARRFKQAMSETAYIPSCQVFHLRS